jgi:hypothetical protein
MRNVPKASHRTLAWRVGLGVVTAVALAIAASARTKGSLRLRRRGSSVGIRRETRRLFRRVEQKVDRTGQRVQEAAQVIGETAADLVDGPGPLSE